MGKLNAFKDNKSTSKFNAVEETVIYDGGEINADFTLSETKENFNEIKVFYIGKTNEGAKIYESEIFEVVEGSQTTELSTMWWSGNTTLLIETLGLTFEGTSVEISHKNALEVGTGDSGAVVTSKGGNYIRPYKVIGIKYVGE